MKKKYLFLSVLSGLLFAVSWPTYGFVILIFGALVPLLFLENLIREDSYKHKKKRFFAYSYLSILIWNVGTTWWLYNSTLFGMLFAILCNTLFYALLLLLFSWSRNRLPNKSAYAFLLFLWLAFEKLHLIWDFSWTWLNLGNAFSEHIYWIQWYAYTGTFGGSLWVLLINLSLFHLLQKVSFRVHPQLFLKRSVPILLGIALPISISLLLYRQVEDVDEKIEVSLLQPNIDPYQTKYRLTNADFLTQMQAMTQDQLSTSTQYLLTPETFFAEGWGERLIGFETSPLYNSLQRFLDAYPNLQLITGIQLYNVYRQKKAPTPTANLEQNELWVDYYNSAMALSTEQAFEVYHKSKLVVGVENMPFKSVLNPLLGKVMLDLGGTVASRATQKERSVFTHPQTTYKAAPIICWESIFGEFVTGYVRNGADFLAVISNDAWWKNTEGHRQLLSYTRLRAIETRRDIARSANTGISAIINAKGEIVAQLDYNTAGVLQGTVSPRDEITFYVRYGDLIARWSALIAGLLFLLALRGKIKKEEPL